jgi:hypothetical protein
MPDDSNNGSTTVKIAGTAAFLTGALGTIVAAITEFGGDDGGLAAARRNHTDLLIWAAVCAAIGLLFGGLYAVASNWPKPQANVRSWLAKNQSWLLVLGTCAVALGVALGAIATTLREPGRPGIQVDRVDDSSVRVQISAEGLQSDAWYEASIRGYGDDLAAYDAPVDERKRKTPVDLLTARFSPGQDGKLDWSARISTADSSGTKIGRILVRVEEGALGRATGLLNCTAAEVTCSFVRVAATASTDEAGR